MCDTVEEWRVIPNYYNYYISNFGRVFSLNRRKFLKPALNYKRYFTISLSRNGTTKTTRVNRLVANLFIKNPEKKPMVDHINNVTTDNHIHNLRWATQKENISNSKLLCKSTTQIKGVSFNKKMQKFVAYICADGIRYHLGSFKTIEEATQKRRQVANELFGVYTNACERL